MFPRDVPPAAGHLVIVCNSGANSLSLYELAALTGRLTPLGTLPLPVDDPPGDACPMALAPDGRMLYVAFRGARRAVLSFRIAGRELHYAGRAEMAESASHLSRSADGRCLFATSYQTGTMSVLPVDASGIALSPTQVIAAAPRLHCSAFTDQSTLHATSIQTDELMAFRYDAGARQLSPAPELAVSCTPGSGPRHLVVHPNGKTAYVMSEYAAAIDVFAFAPGQSPKLVQSAPAMPAGSNAKPWGADIRITPDGRFVYATERRTNTISAFATGSAGRLTPVSHHDTAASPRAFNIDPSGRHVLVLAEQGNAIESFAIDPATGRLDKRDEAPTGQGPSWVELVPLA